MVKYLAVFLFLYVSDLSYSQSAQWEWARHETWGSGFTVETDQDGDVYCTGYTADTSSVFGYPVSAGSDQVYHTFIAKLDPAGNLLWIKAIHGDYKITIKGFVLDDDKNIFIGGNFQGDSLLLDTLKLYNNSPGSEDENLFLAKLDPSGNVLWALGGTCDYDSGVADLCIDPAGNISMLGMYSFTATTLDTITLPSGSGNQTFVAKFNTNGRILWAQNFTGSLSSTALSICQNDNKLYIGGYHSWPISVGVDTLFGSGYCLAKFDLGGELDWLKVSPGPVNIISINSVNDLFIAGNFSGTLIVGTDTLVSEGMGDFCVTKCDTAGNAIWARGVGSYKSENCTDIAADNSGGVCIAGTHQGDSIVVDGVTYYSYSFWSHSVVDILYVKYNSSGGIDWAKVVGGLQGDFCADLAYSGSGNVLYTTGTFESPQVDFDTTTLYSLCPYPPPVGYPNAFVARLGELPLSVHDEIAGIPGISVYPNPFTDEFNFSIRDFEPYKDLKIELTDILGKVVYESSVLSRTGSVYISEAPGLYVLKLISEGKLFSAERIVKIR